jgi:membrane protein CcdC involved in cytochrome C biogenesis
MGHLGELILAGALLFMALAGVGWRLPEIERPLGAFAAFFVQMQTLRFAWRLRHDAAFLAEYGEGKGGAMMNDLEVIALDLKIWTGVSTDVRELAGWLLFLAFVVPAAAILLYVFRRRIHDFARSLLVLEPLD